MIVSLFRTNYREYEVILSFSIFPRFFKANTKMSVTPIGYSKREATIMSGAGDAAFGYHREETTGVGDIRETGIHVTIRNNYAARYNFAVGNYNSLPLEDEKKTMRGGHFLVYRYIVVIFWLISMIFAGVSSAVKPLVTVPIIISLVYIALSIYNIVIFKKNGYLLHRKLMIHNNRLGSNNEWYTVPIHTHIQNTAALAAVGGDDSAAMAALRETYTNVEEIKIMVYTGRYITLFTYFPTRSIVLHIAMFTISLLLGIVLVSIIH
jgi:hypothetical protein